MHILQPRHTILKQDATEDILKKYNISLSQLPKIRIVDTALPKGAVVGDVIKIERKEETKTTVYYRVVVP